MESSLVLSEALPVTGRALLLKTSFNQSLIDSLKYLLEVCEEVLTKDDFSKATQNLNSLNPDLKLSALLGILHVDFFNAVEKQDLERVQRIVERLTRDTYQLQEMTYVNWSDLHDYYTPLAATTLVYDRLEEIHFVPVMSEEFKEATNSIQRGLNVYKDAFPDFFQEFQEIVGEILIINAQGIRAGSSFDMFGMIFMGISTGYFDKWKDKITGVLDLIVHEQSHLYVHLLANNDMLVLNRFERYEAPLRKEKRPLIGIYHAAFVLSRIQYVLSKALAYNVIPDSEKENCKQCVDYYRERCQLGLEILKKHAQMTPLAEALITSAGKLL